MKFTSEPATREEPLCSCVFSTFVESSFVVRCTCIAGVVVLLSRQKRMRKTGTNVFANEHMPMPADRSTCEFRFYFLSFFGTTFVRDSLEVIICVPMNFRLGEAQTHDEICSSLNQFENTFFFFSFLLSSP